MSDEKTTTSDDGSGWILLDPFEFQRDAGHHVTELMYRMATGIFTTVDRLLVELADPAMQAALPRPEGDRR